MSSMARFVKLLATRAQKVESRSTEESDFYFIHLIVGKDKKAIPDTEFFGCQTIRKGHHESRYPIIITVDGDIDYGSSYDDYGEEVYRSGKINIKEKTIAEGEYFTIFYCGDEMTYRIEEAIYQDVID